MKTGRMGVVMKCLLAAALVLGLGVCIGTAAGDALLDEQLIQAAECGDLVRLKTLLDMGANVNAKNKDDESALMRAAWFSHLDVAKVLTEHGAKTTLIIAAMLGDKQEVLRLIEEGFDVNARAPSGFTPLLGAAAKGHLEVVRVLLDHGAEINAELKDGQTSLIQAKQRGHREIVGLLYARGAIETQSTKLVYVALTKFGCVLLILYGIACSTGNDAHHRAFFGRQKWTLKEAYDNLVPVMVAIYVYGIMLPVEEGYSPAWSDRHMWGAAFAGFLVFYYFSIGRPYGIRWVDFGIDKTHLRGSGVPAFNITGGYFALLAAGVSIPPLNRLTTESRLLCSWLDTAIIGFGLAFCEELLFRGILYAPVARQVGKWFAIVALSLVECLIHTKLDVPQSGVLFAMFVIFYCVYIRTESLLAPLILHIGINIPLWQPMGMAVMARHLPTSTVELLYICTPLLALVIVDAWWVINFLSRRKHRLAPKNDTELRKG